MKECVKRCVKHWDLNTHLKEYEAFIKKIRKSMSVYVKGGGI